MGLRSRLAAMEEPTGVKGGWGLLAGSAVVIVGVPIADAFLPHDIHLAHVLVVPVALVSAFGGPRRGFVAALLSVASILVASGERHVLSTENVIVELVSLIVLSVLLILFSHLREKRERELERLRLASDTAQGVVLRALPPRAGPLSIASEYMAADLGTRVGGDMYAVARTAHATRLLIGDVRGHGLSSIGDTESVLGAFRAEAHRQGPLPQLVASLEEGFRWSLTELPEGPSQTDTGERFVTAAIIEIPDDEPCAHVINCGHPSPLLLHRGDATLLNVPEPAPPLGLGTLGRMGESAYAVSTFPFAPGDRLILYTDGVTEARDPSGAFYPLLARAVTWGGDRPGPLLKAMTGDLLAHVAGPLEDDMAVVAVQREIRARAR
ncbi:PP2C family protein-serine/threonine phosphatase [Streptomyces polygonati]|uniref:PP2C family protein-serine/threonine phosphatase n=1 Tax=Streptomyces polygonati TaxID=1617087 RepID=A0ABV8HX23_9ACTN